MGPEATSSAIYCFLKRQVARAAQQLKASDAETQQSDSVIPQQESRTSDHLLSSASPENSTKSQPESFRYKANGDIHRCMLCLRQFDGESSLTTHESRSEMHQSNLEDPILVAQGRSRLAKILRSTVNNLVDNWITTKPMSIAALVESLQALEAVTAN